MREALKTAEADLEADAWYLFPATLDKTPHAVLDKANSLAADPNADRMRIEAIADRHVIKVKTGPNRAAMWQDEDGQWWLLAAGRRRDDGSGDFYRELEKYGNDSAPIAPTQRDKDYLRFEAAYSNERQSEQTVHAAVLQALLTAAAKLRQLPRASLVEPSASEQSGRAGGTLAAAIICCRSSFATLDRCRCSLFENSDNLFAGDSEMTSDCEGLDSTFVAHSS